MRLFVSLGKGLHSPCLSGTPYSPPPALPRRHSKGCFFVAIVEFSLASLDTLFSACGGGSGVCLPPEVAAEASPGSLFLRACHMSLKYRLTPIYD